jgi:WD40 repeat protein
MTTPQPAGARVGSSPNRARRRWIVGASAAPLGLLAVLGVVVIVPLLNAPSPPPPIAENVLAGHTDTVETVRVWDPATGGPIGQPLTGHTSFVKSVATAQLDGRPVIVSGSDDKTVRVWDLATGAPIGQPFTGHTSFVKSVATAQLDGRPVVVSGSDDKTLRVWDLATGAPIGQPLTGHTDFVQSVATAQLNGRPVIVSGSYDTSIRVWDLARRVGS